MANETATCTHNKKPAIFLFDPEAIASKRNDGGSIMFLNVGSQRIYIF